MTCGQDAKPDTTAATAATATKPGVPHLVKKNPASGLPDTITPPKVPTLSNLPGSGSALTCPKNKLTATPL